MPEKRSRGKKRSIPFRCFYYFLLLHLSLLSFKRSASFPEKKRLFFQFWDPRAEIVIVHLGQYWRFHFPCFWARGEGETPITHIHKNTSQPPVDKLIPPESHSGANRQDYGFRQKGAFLAILVMTFPYKRHNFMIGAFQNSKKVNLNLTTFCNNVSVTRNRIFQNS